MKRKLVETFFVVLASGMACLNPWIMAQDAPPKKESGAEKPIPLSVPLKENDNEVTALLSTGNAQGLKISLVWDDGKSTILNAQAMADSFKKTPKTGDPKNADPLALPYAFINFPEIGIRHYIRPNLFFYSDKFKNELYEKWDTFPSAGQHFFKFTIRLDQGGLEYWIDGRYAGRLDKNSRLKELIFAPSPGASVRDAKAYRQENDPRFLSLSMKDFARPGLMKDAELSLKPGKNEINGTPLLLETGKDNADIGLLKEMSQSGMVTDPFLSRSAFTGMPESLIVSVPVAQYSRAWVLCAAEADASKAPILTARLTRYANDGRGSSIADTSITIPSGNAEKPAPGIVKAGTLDYTLEGRKISVPLWLAEIPLKSGEIPDILFSDKISVLKFPRYLDFELLGKQDSLYGQKDRTHKPDPNSNSGVHVFAVTLERSPVEMEIRHAQPGNIFHNDETPETYLLLRPQAKGDYEVRWKIRDITGKILQEKSQKLSLKQAGLEEKFTIPLSMPELGWYGLDIALCEGKKQLLGHTASFALLGKDTRKAGYESPYGTWWFGYCHHGSTDPQLFAPLMFKAGLRKTTMAWAGDKNTEAELAPWKLTLFQIPWMGKLSEHDNADALKKYEEKIRDWLKKFPHADSALIFHESYRNTMPAELRDAAPPVPDQKTQETEKQYLNLATNVSKMYREKFPQLKLIFGNSCTSAELMAMLFRQKFPKEYVDFMGIEGAVQSFMPEKLNEWGGAPAAWVLRETARKFGHELPVTSCYEWSYRCERDLGSQRHAEWYVRDALIAHAFGFRSISIGLLHDVDNAYYNSLWGGSGLCLRQPLLYPRPAYVAYATLTKVLDQVKLRRRVPTGSNTVYVLEFERGNETVYALWTPRGEAKMDFEFAKDSVLALIDLYGRSKELKTQGGKLSISGSTAPCYLVAQAPVRTVLAGKRTYPEDAPPANLKVANKMDKADDWYLKGDDYRISCPDNPYIPMRTIGYYQLRQADDQEKGRCVELELIHKGKVPEIMQEYALMRLKQPVEISGTPTTLGVWVKGNSGWGRVMFEFEDAEGEIFMSTGMAGFDCDILDWPGILSVSFDGWNFLRFPITEKSPEKIISAGGLKAQWVSNGKKKVDYPIRVTGLIVEMSRKALDLTEMKPVNTILRFRDLSTFE